MKHLHYPYSQPIDTLLNKLTKVSTKKPNKKGLNQWQALCPAHEDKTPSLAITESNDGTVLVKCWSGCTAKQIVNAIGLELKDLFKDEPNLTHKVNNGNHKLLAKKLPHPQAIEHEQLIIAIAQAHFNQGLTLSNEDLSRYQLAQKRLNLLKQYTEG